MKDMWDNCVQLMDELQKEMQTAVEKTIEEIT
jgi:hypothetical protein